MVVVESQIFAQKLWQLGQMATADRLLQQARSQGIPQDSLRRIVFTPQGELDSSGSIFWNTQRFSLDAAQQGKWEEAVCMREMVLGSSDALWRIGNVCVQNPATDYISRFIDTLYPSLRQPKIARLMGKQSKYEIGKTVSDMLYTFASQHALEVGVESADSSFLKTRLQEGQMYYMRLLRELVDSVSTLDTKIRKITGSRLPLLPLVEATSLDHGLAIPLSQFQ